MKPPTGIYDGYAQNEHFCLRLAAAFGFTTCSSRVIKIEDETAICVERYDRQKTGSTWHRIHQEDLCQALGVRPELKYQNEGGPSAADVGKLLQTYSSHRMGDEVDFFVSLVFNWFIGGSDAHAKNYSLLLEAGQTSRLAPLYDISSALPYDNIDRRRLKMAMKIGSAYRWYNIRISDWENHLATMNIAGLDARDVLDTVARALPDLADEVAGEVAAEGMGHIVVDRLVREIKSAASKCTAMLNASVA